MAAGKPSDSELLRRVVMDYADKCCDDLNTCLCSMAIAFRRIQRRMEGR